MFFQDTSEYQRTLVREIECRLDAKCEALADIFAMNDNGKCYS